MLMQYDHAVAQSLIPLLRSIAEEITERLDALSKLEPKLEHELDDRRVRLLIGEIADNRRELRHAFSEVENLGCAVVETRPVTFQIRIESEVQPRRLVYQTGDANAA